MQLKHLVIGTGQVGTGVQAVLGCDGYDQKQGMVEQGEYDVIHVCFPYGEGFEDAVRTYKNDYKAKYVVIHSTIPVGTCKGLGAIHSPIRGVHPFLAESIKTFVKYFGGRGAEEVVPDFEEKGVKCVILENSDTCELMKLVDTTTYGINILIEKEIAKLSERYGVPHKQVYNDANITYNEGYQALGSPQFSKYNLKHMDGPIGGHCIMQNADLLPGTWLTDVLKEKNQLYA